MKRRRYGMKRVCVGLAVLCLAASTLFAFTPLPSFYENWTEEEIERLREDCKDAEKLKGRLEEILPVTPIGMARHIEEFKQKFGVKDEVLLAATLSLARTPHLKARMWHAKSMEEASKIHAMLYSLMGLLSFCADAECKALLLEQTTDFSDEKSGRVRWMAIYYYLLCADARETRDALARFLADPREKLLDVHYRTMLVYDMAAYDEQKREAIVEATSAALMKETDEKTFARVDGDLANWSKAYADSPQRKAKLERMAKPPEKPKQGKEQ
jgi:hypothetical protein